MPQATQNFSPCGASETVLRGISFLHGIAAGESLVSGSATCVITVSSTSSVPDSAPQSRLLGGPTVNATQVDVLLGTMLNGVTYQVLISVMTTSGETLSAWALQSCTAP